MNKFSKIAIFILVLITLFYVKENVFDKFDGSHKVKVPEISSVDVEDKSKIQETTEKEYVTLFFIANSRDGVAVFRKIQREYNSGNRLEFAISELLNGPTYIEKKAGAFTEIPRGTKLINVQEHGNNVIINLSSNFQYGGGTDSIYSRMRQLIKTALSNSENKNIYLYLDGKQVDVLGGEGIMVSQPLSESSLDD